MNGEYIKDVIIIILSLCCMYSDVKTRKIKNKLLLPFLIGGVVVNTFCYGLHGMIDAMLGMGLGLAILFIPFAMRGLCGGDVKMLMTVGAVGGANFVVGTALCMAIIGGILSLVVMIKNKMLGICLRKIIRYLFFAFYIKQFNKWEGEEALEKVYIPYGLAIGLGAILFIILY